MQPVAAKIAELDFNVTIIYYFRWANACLTGVGFFLNRYPKQVLKMAS